MPYFIKTGYWDLLSKAPKGFLNLDLVTGGGGGGGNIPTDIWFVVGSGGDINVAAGQSSISLPAEFIGKRIRVYRNNILLDNSQMNGFSDSYFTYTVGDSFFELSQDTVADEKFVITAY
jgi:hypothetical protein